MGAMLVRRLIAIAAAGAVMLAAGCEASAAGEPGHGVEWPAAAAGKACQLVDYDGVATVIGTRFDTAGGAQVGDTYTCALTAAGAEYPDLTLSMTATTIDEVIFVATIKPSGSKGVKGLGRIAYSLHVPAKGDAGPVVEIGWLSANGRLMIMRYTFAKGATEEQVATTTADLVTLAKQVDGAKSS